jgi:DNA-binding beta-propeller fold protein YncE
LRVVTLAAVFVSCVIAGPALVFAQSPFADDFEYSFDGSRNDFWQKQARRWYFGEANWCDLRHEHVFTVEDQDLCLRVPADVTEGGLVNSLRTDFHFGSYRARMRTPAAPGVVSAFFYYYSDSSEIDIELLSGEHDAGTLHFVCHPSATPGAYKMVDLGFDPSADFHEYRFDWYPGRAELWVDGAYREAITVNVPFAPGNIILSNWTGNPYWGEGPPEETAELLVDSVHYDPWGSAGDVVEVWRSPFGRARSVSVNPNDGSCWAATGSSVMHVAADGTVLSQTDGFWSPGSVSVNATDGSCWVADARNDAVVHLAEDGSELCRAVGFTSPQAVSANSADGSCWVADGGSNEIVHLTESCTELSRLGGFTGLRSVSVDSSNGSVWVAHDSEVVHLAADGTELALCADFVSPRSVSVNPTDQSCWVADIPSECTGRIVHLSAECEVLGQAETDLWEPRSVSVNPADGTCWATGGRYVPPAPCLGWVALFDEGCNELWRATNLRFPGAVSANPLDGSAWVADTDNCAVVRFARNEEGDAFEENPRLARFLRPKSVSTSANPYDRSCWVANTFRHTIDHVDEHGNELSSSNGFKHPSGVSVNPTDGSCWVGNPDPPRVVHLASDGGELCRLEREQPQRPGSVSVNPRDGSCWVADHASDEVLHLDKDCNELDRVGGFSAPSSASVNWRDGSCWVADKGHDQVVHLDADCNELLRLGGFLSPSSVSVNSWDGSCWVADTGNDQIVHLDKDGAELQRVGGFLAPLSVAVNSWDGSCWVADTGNNQMVHLAYDGTELWRGDGFDSPRGLSVNPTDGSCWVADFSNGQVVHLAVCGYVAPPFKDVPVYFWAGPEVVACANADIVLGYEDGLYHPEREVSRDQMAVFVATTSVLADYVPAEPRNFLDVDSEHWAYSYVEYCVEHGIVGGYPEGDYRPDVVVTRDQMAVYVSRAFGLVD